jgi:hypothetical protein
MHSVSMRVSDYRWLPPKAISVTKELFLSGHELNQRNTVIINANTLNVVQIRFSMRAS